MTRVIYVNGRYKSYRDAAIHPEDRGFQLGDAVYEVCEVYDGAIIDFDRHLERLRRSLAELQINEPMHPAALLHVMRQTIKRNRVRYGIVYLQVSRGAQPRDFIPNDGLKPTLVCIARRGYPERIAAQAEAGIGVVTVPDIRWRRCDIKTVMLLPAVLAKVEARASGAREAWLVDQDGFVTEGASSNAWIVDDAGRLVTRPISTAILAGVTRRTLIDALQREGLELIERPFTPAEAMRAREAFYTAASSTVMPVVRIDGQPIGDGKPGPIALRLREVFHEVARRTPA